VWRSPARYLWAMLLARLYESTPLLCPNCKADRRIVAFITDGDSVRPILEPIGESADPPRISPARGPPLWEADLEVESLPLYDPTAQPGPDFPFDQTQGGVLPPATGRHRPVGVGVLPAPHRPAGTRFLPIPAKAPRLPATPLRSRLVVPRRATSGLDWIPGEGGNFRMYGWISYPFPLIPPLRTPASREKPPP
jgi:hypothetical protein